MQLTFYMCYCVYVELFIRSISNSLEISLTKSDCSNLQIYNIFINITISSVSAKIYVLYIRIKKNMNTGVGIRDVRRHGHEGLFLHSIEMHI